MSAGALAGPLWLVGCGKMGGALAAGWLNAGLHAGDLLVVEPADGLRAPWAERGAVTVASVAALAGPDRPEEVPRALVLAVKPQQMTDVLEALHGRVPPSTAIISIAAGTPIAPYAHALGDRRAIIRAMPNTPAAIGRGITALIANDAADPVAKALATSLLEAVGATVWLEDESQMHVVTALSGGGPAYVFWLIETLAAAGAAQGLAPEVALRLARDTVAGAGALAVADATTPPAELRRNVTSPGGTTAEALAVLMADDGLAPLVDLALRAAAERSRVLGGEAAGR